MPKIKVNNRPFLPISIAFCFSRTPPSLCRRRSLLKTFRAISAKRDFCFFVITSLSATVAIHTDEHEERKNRKAREFNLSVFTTALRPPMLYHSVLITSKNMARLLNAFASVTGLSSTLPKHIISVTGWLSLSLCSFLLFFFLFSFIFETSQTK